jgi:hypothetical protein
MFWWDTIRKPHWPASFPVTETDLELIDPLVLSEIKNTLPKFAYSNDDSFTFWRKHLEDKHQHEVLARLFVATTDRGITEWNTDWYLSRETTITEIKNLYDKFGLSNYNEKLIGKYFDHWTSTLNRLKDSRNENST